MVHVRLPRKLLDLSDKGWVSHWLLIGVEGKDLVSLVQVVVQQKHLRIASREVPEWSPNFLIVFIWLRSFRLWSLSHHSCLRNGGDANLGLNVRLVQNELRDFSVTKEVGVGVDTQIWSVYPIIVLAGGVDFMRSHSEVVERLVVAVDELTVLDGIRGA